MSMNMHSHINGLLKYYLLNMIQLFLRQHNIKVIHLGRNSAKVKGPHVTWSTVLQWNRKNKKSNCYLSEHSRYSMQYETAMSYNIKKSFSPPSKKQTHAPHFILCFLCVWKLSFSLHFIKVKLSRNYLKQTNNDQ